MSIMKNMNIITCAIWLVILESSLTVNAAMTCMDHNNNPIDWFIYYKLPKNSESSNPFIKAGLGYFYMDLNNQKWVLGTTSLNSSTHALAYTLQQIYDNVSSGKDFMYAMYNDEHPDGKKTDSYGHTKGVLASDTNAGFWLIHSVPKFPQEASGSHNSYMYPTSGTEYGQTFLCMTLAYSQMNLIGNLWLYTHPWVFDSKLANSYSSQNPKLDDVVNHKRHVMAEPWNFTQDIVSREGNNFRAFVKYTKWDAELYSVWVAPYYQSDLNVETWPNGVGNFDSNCTGKYKVFKNDYISIPGSGYSGSVVVKETRDHSKWAITVNNPDVKFVCIGDINRQHGQLKRAGGTVCMDIPGVYTAFKATLYKDDKCANKKLYWKRKDYRLNIL